MMTMVFVLSEVEGNVMELWTLFLAGLILLAFI